MRIPTIKNQFIDEKRLASDTMSFHTNVPLRVAVYVRPVLPCLPL